MALHFQLKVNGHGIGHAIDIIRLNDVDPGPDSVCRYRVQAVADNGTKKARQFSAVVEHRYGDGAWVLAQKAMAALDFGAGA